MSKLLDLSSDVVGNILEFIVPIDNNASRYLERIDLNDLGEESLDKIANQIVVLSSVSRNFYDLIEGEEKIQAFWKNLMTYESNGILNRMWERIHDLTSDDLRRKMILLRKFRRLLRKPENLKLIHILGEEKVGKSKIVNDYIKDFRWRPSDRFSSRVRADINEEVYHFDLCERFEGFSDGDTLKTFKNADAFVIVMSLDKSVNSSQEFIGNLIETIQKMKPIKTLIIPIVFVINKLEIPLDKRTSSVEDWKGLALELIESYNLLNTSIVENGNSHDLSKIFSNIVNQLQWDDLLLEQILEQDSNYFSEVGGISHALTGGEAHSEKEPEEVAHLPIAISHEEKSKSTNQQAKKEKSNKECIIN